METSLDTLCLTREGTCHVAYASLGITFSCNNCVTSGFRREVEKNCALLGYCKQW